MSSFEAFAEYSRAEVRARLGAAREEGAFFVAAGRAACLARLGTAPAQARFTDRSTLAWRGECPDAVLKERPMLVDVFVQRGPDAFSYVGQAQVVGHEYDAAGQLLDVRFHLPEALPRKRWLEFRGSTELSDPPGPPAEAEISRLTRESGLFERMGALRTFLERWHGIRLDRRPSRRAARGLPAPLAELHRLVAGVEGVIAQNLLVEPTLEDGRLIFYVENQGVCHWATETTGDDPPVWWRLNEPGEVWQREEEPLSGFLIQLVLFEAMLGASCGAHPGTLDAAAAERLCERMRPLPLGTWLWPGQGMQSRFYAREGALMFLAAAGDGWFDGWLAARRPEALTFLEDLVADTWCHVAF
ncbi:MAG TPA: hypothetical protein VEL05_03275 [Candidatus Acidoferrum sp.]|nr:hypothetical protein [Candidatus Acidoferrum sp.]